MIYPNLITESFIEDNADTIDWREVDYSNIEALSDEFIERFKHEFDWEKISCTRGLSESFIEKHIDKINWHNISAFQKLSEHFIEKHGDEIYNWFYLHTKHLSKEFLEKHKEKFRVPLLGG
jgi:hypothetical protein